MYSLILTVTMIGYRVLKIHERHELTLYNTKLNPYYFITLTIHELDHQIQQITIVGECY